MSRKCYLLCLLCLAVGALACQEEPSTTTTKPQAASTAHGTQDSPPLNVVLITIDTLRADALGVNGQRRPASPYMDRMAKEGVNFRQAMTSAPSTLPSHSSIMTAKQPYAHGVRANSGYVLSGNNATLAEAMRRAGYRTGAEIAAVVLDHVTQLNQGFDHYRDMNFRDVTRKSISIPQVSGEAREVQLDERSAGDITKFGIEFIGNNRRDPFFLWLHYFDPHAHYTAPETYNNLIPDSPYHAEVRYVDVEVGRLVAHLDRLGLRERTIVVITADHGEGLGEHGEDTHANYLFQSTLRVPLIFSGPSNLVRKNLQVDSLVRTIDIAPTLLDLLDLPPLKDVQGRSLVPLLTGESSDLKLTGYGESLEIRSMFGSSVLRSLQQGRWKYIHKLRPALYDLRHDPSEMDDVAAKYPEKVNELTTTLYDLIRDAPAKPQNSEVVIDEETIRQLQALGYAGAGPSKEVADEMESLALKGPDPSDLLADLQAFSEAMHFSSIQEYDQALDQLNDLSGRHPRSLKILMALADTLTHLEKWEASVAVLRRAIEADSQSEKAYSMLAQAEEALGHFKESEAAARMSLQIEPCTSASRLRLASIFNQSDRRGQAVETLREGIRACPDSYEVLNNYAFILSTSPDDEIRDGAEAVRSAILALEGAGGESPEILDTLAGAYAEIGDYKRARDASQRSIEFAEKQQLPAEIIDLLSRNHAQLEKGLPLRQN